MPPPKPGNDPLCGYCRMPLSMHCKGNVDHTGEGKSRRRTVCVSRHCLAPLCDCVSFVEEQEDVPGKAGPEAAQEPR